MTINCKVELNGFLGADPKSISKNGKTFIALRVATTDSYPVKDEKTGEIKWNHQMKGQQINRMAYQLK